jgi:hypothetical protein
VQQLLEASPAPGQQVGTAPLRQTAGRSGAEAEQPGHAARNQFTRSQLTADTPGSMLNRDTWSFM